MRNLVGCLWLGFAGSLFLIGLTAAGVGIPVFPLVAPFVIGAAVIGIGVMLVRRSWMLWLSATCAGALAWLTVGWFIGSSDDFYLMLALLLAVAIAAALGSVAGAVREHRARS
jgi:hypothetical protein